MVLAADANAVIIGTVTDNYGVFAVDYTAVVPVTASVVSHTDCDLLSTFLARWTLARISSALAVHTNGLGDRLCC